MSLTGRDLDSEIKREPWRHLSRMTCWDRFQREIESVGESRLGGKNQKQEGREETIVPVPASADGLGGVTEGGQPRPVTDRCRVGRKRRDSASQAAHPSSQCHAWVSYKMLF